MSEAIVVIISRNGDVVIDAEGYTGSSCESATRFLTEALKVQSTTEKPEFYEQTHDQDININRQP